MILTIENIYTYIDFKGNDILADQVYKKLHYGIGVRDKDFYMRKNSFGNWDGIHDFYDKEKRRFPTGILSQVVHHLGEMQERDPSLVFEYNDLRNEPRLLPNEVDDEIELGAGNGTITLRDYQQEAIESIMNDRVGILNLAVNAGKSSVGAAAIQQLLPKMRDGENIAFFTHSKSIYSQAKKELEERLAMELGDYNADKKNIMPVTMVMIPTLVKALESPLKGLKLNHKERVAKRLAEEISPLFSQGVNTKKLIKNYMQNLSVKTKPDQEIYDVLQHYAMSDLTDNKIQLEMRKFPVQFEKMVQKKVGTKYKKHQEAKDFVDSIVVMVADECLVGDTQVRMDDNSYKRIDEIQVGDIVRGGKVLEVKEVTSPTVYVELEDGSHLEGSLTHPMFVHRNGRGNMGMVLALGKLKVGDNLVRINEDRSSTHTRVAHMEIRSDEQKLYDITTESKTFIANGFLSHNCHHANANTWFNTLMLCDNAEYRIGLSGSVDEKDKLTWQRLQSVFGGISAKVRNKTLIDAGHSATPTIYTMPIKKPWNIEHDGNYQSVYKKGIVENEYRNNVIGKLTQMCYNDGKGILIIVNHTTHGEILSEILNELDIPHSYIHGGISNEDRDYELNRMRSGELKVIVATNIFDEGVSVNAVDTLILAAGGKSARQVVQRIGRVLRKKEDDNTAQVFDFNDLTNRFLKKQSKERRKIYEEEEFKVVDLKLEN